MSSDGILGSIYWPIFEPFQVLRSEKIPYPFPTSALFSNSTEVYCPHLNHSDDCILGNDRKKKCGYKDQLKGTCAYDIYHKRFLLLEETSNNKGNGFLKYFDEKATTNVYETFKDLYSSKKSTHFLNTINAFPQPDDSRLVALKEARDGIPDGLFFHIKDEYKTISGAIKADSHDSSFLINDIVYAKSEFSKLGADEQMNASSDAFHLLTIKDKINNLLPPNSIHKASDELDIYLPVYLSFFADSKVDAALSLAIRTKKSKIEGNATLVMQALGSMREVIYNQRQEFLEKWCMRLGERVDDKCQKKNPKDHQDKATKEAMRFALQAILNMVQSLAAQPEPNAAKSSASNIETIIKLFEYDTSKNKKPEQIFTYINKVYIKNEFDGACSDRKKYVIDFCKKAEMYAAEFVASEGKLKGRLSAPTVRELKKISHTSDPVCARILIRGEPGGGKGVTAEDFHYYCMKRIAEPINKNVKNYIEKVKDRLKTIFQLPANYNTHIAGASASLFFRQISNTGWWLWNQSIKNNTFGKKISNLLTKQKLVMQKINVLTESEFFEKNGKVYEDILIKDFSSLLKKKISLEIKSGKPDFSFNFLQVNCGILGGENSELTETIERLFGKAGDHQTAMPGIFQTCSYMGGTLFLDEIADAPVRIQDNLLRPLEEGTVSRPGWETFDEKVDNIRIVGATFKDLFKLAQQYQETLPSGHPKGFRPDLLTRLTRNTPVSVTPVWHYFVPTEPIDDDFPSQFAFVCNNSWKVSTNFWHKVYVKVSKQINEHIARHHNPDRLEGRRKIASKITMRLFKEVGKIAQLKNSTKEQRDSALEYLGRMLDYLLVETN